MTKIWLLVNYDTVLSVWDSEYGARAEWKKWVERYDWFEYSMTIEEFILNVGRWSNLP